MGKKTGICFQGADTTVEETNNKKVNKISDSDKRSDENNRDTTTGTDEETASELRPR